MKSISKKLLWYLSLTVLMVTGLTFFVSYQSSQHEFTEIFDANMQQVAFALASTDITQIQSTPEIRENLKSPLDHEEEFLIQIWDHNQNLIYISHPDIDFPQHPDKHFHDIEFEAHKWRTYVYKTSSGHIQISQPLDVRSDVIYEALIGMLLPIVLQLPIILVLIYLIVGNGLRPLNALSESIRQRTEDNLTPIGDDHMPYELQSVTSALNRLFERLKKALSLQRQFTADAAHELRTPLTALNLQLDILNRSKTDDERQDAVSNLRDGITRATHLVQNLLLLARGNSDVQDYQTIDLCKTLHNLTQRLKPLSDEKGQTLEYIPDGCPMDLRGAEADFITIFENIISNAILYTPENGRVDIKTEKSDEGYEISIIDNGSGISDTDKTRIFDRFYRVLGSDKMGSGLGLSIASDRTEKYGGTIKISDNPNGRGAVFTVFFPLK